MVHAPVDSIQAEGEAPAPIVDEVTPLIVGKKISKYFPMAFVRRTEKGENHEIAVGYERQSVRTRVVNCRTRWHKRHTSAAGWAFRLATELSVVGHAVTDWNDNQSQHGGKT